MIVILSDKSFKLGAYHGNDKTAIQGRVSLWVETVVQIVVPVGTSLIGCLVSAEAKDSEENQENCVVWRRTNETSMRPSLGRSFDFVVAGRGATDIWFRTPDGKSAAARIIGENRPGLNGSDLINV